MYTCRFGNIQRKFIAKFITRSAVTFDTKSSLCHINVHPPIRAIELHKKPLDYFCCKKSKFEDFSTTRFARLKQNRSPMDST